ncbi:hypothetical protein Dimus_018458, partial [Dionaea muscipula]
KRLFGKAENPKKRRTSTSPVVGKKEKKKVRKLILNSPSVASSTGPAKGNSAEEVEQRSLVGEAHEGEQARDVAQDPPQDAQDPIDANVGVVRIGKEAEEAAATVDAADSAGEGLVKAVEDDPIIIDDLINIDKEIQRFNAWLSWKLSRSRAQVYSIERMHAEEDWVMGMVECYELFELVDAGKLFEFFKVGAAAHKRHAIKRGKRPEGEGSEGGKNDDDHQGGNNPNLPKSQPQPQPQNQSPT